VRRILLAFCFVSLAAGSYSAAYPPDEVPFVATPIELVDRMLDLAELKPGDVLYDLGSGDGRIVIRAAERYGVRAVGIELDSWLVAKARAAAKQAGVADRVEFRNEDAAKADLTGATVVTLYMLPWFNDAMKDKFRAELKPGARIVSHDYGIEGWPADKIEMTAIVERRAAGFIHEHTLFFWRVK